MRDLFIKAVKHPLITGSSIVFIGSFITSIFGYLFNLAMGRMLPVADYGLLIALTSLLGMLVIFDTALTKIFARFSARYISKGEHGKISYLITLGVKYVFLLSLGFLIILLLSTGLVGNFLRIDSHFLIIMIFLSVFIGLISSVPDGVIQGDMRFYMSSLLKIISSFIKFVVAVLLVFLGFQVFGAILAIVISSVVVTIAGYVVVLKYIKKKSEAIPNFRGEFTHYTYTFILTTLGITLLSNTDIILVRHFFEETVSGQYAALSLMGKAIFFLIMPINFVFFPLIAQKKERKERLFNTVMFTSGIVLTASIAMSFVYFAFPGLVLRIFFPAPEYQVLKSYLGLFSLYILIFSLVNIMNSYFLSIGKTKVYAFTLIAAFAQIGLILFFHNSLYQIIGVLFMVNFLLLLSYFIYYMRHGKD